MLGRLLGGTRKRLMATTTVVLVAIPLTFPLWVPFAATRHPALMAALAGPTGWDMGCLALNSYRERARLEDQGFDETHEGLMAIAWVVKTRLQLGFHQSGNPVPTNFCGVVYETAQFSWTLGDYDYRYTVADVGDFYRAWWAAWHVTLETGEARAVRFFLGPVDHYFNADVVLPEWAAGFRYDLKIGKHQFYTDTARYPTMRSQLDARYGVRKH